MNKKIVIISIFILFIISSIVIANKITYDEATDLGKKYEISGSIKDTNGESVSGCTVDLLGSNNTNAAVIQDGKFEYKNIPEGKYKLKIQYDTNKYEVESITKKKEEKFSLGSDYSICFMYPESSEEVSNLVDELANKLRYISYCNGLKKVKIYESKYKDQENLEDATKKILQDNKNFKLIVAFANNKEFISRCKEKQEDLGVQPNISISSPYRILGIYLNGNIEEHMEGLYSNFFIGYQGELNKQSILDKIYEIYNSNIMKMSKDDRIDIKFKLKEGYIETEDLKIENVHDNDTTNSIEIILKKKGDSAENQNPTTTTPTTPNTSQQLPIQTATIPIVVPSSDPNVPEKRIEVKVSKKVAAIKLILSDGSVFIDEAGTEIKWSVPEELKVIHIDEELMHGATIQIEYEMTIENTSTEFDLPKIELGDCLNYKYNNNIVYDQELKLLTDPSKKNKSQGWESIKQDGKDWLKTTIDQIEQENIATKKLVISKVISTQEDEMYYENHMKIGDCLVKSPQIIIIPPTGKTNM